MRHQEDIKLRDFLEAEWQNQFDESRDDLRLQAKQQVLKVQEENRKTYNLRRRKPNLRSEGHLITIKRTLMIPG